jgi:hypothetical protein
MTAAPAPLFIEAKELRAPSLTIPSAIADIGFDNLGNHLGILAYQGKKKEVVFTILISKPFSPSHHHIEIAAL